MYTFHLTYPERDWKQHTEESPTENMQTPHGEIKLDQIQDLLAVIVNHKIEAEYSSIQSCSLAVVENKVSLLV